MRSTWSYLGVAWRAYSLGYVHLLLMEGEAVALLPIAARSQKKIALLLSFLALRFTNHLL